MKLKTIKTKQNNYGTALFSCTPGGVLVYVRISYNRDTTTCYSGGISEYWYCNNMLNNWHGFCSVGNYWTFNTSKKMWITALIFLGVLVGAYLLDKYAQIMNDDKNN